MSKHILTDVDGVLLNWASPFAAYMKSKGYVASSDVWNTFSVSKRYGITSAQAMSEIRTFNESEHIGRLPALADSVEYVRKLHNDGYEFTCVTSVSSAPQSYTYRLDNLNEVFGIKFKELICLEMGEPKEEILKRWKDSNYFWIEDNPGQAEAGLKNGLRPILINHPYNTEHHCSDDFYNVDVENAWRDIYNYIVESQ